MNRFLRRPKPRDVQRSLELLAALSPKTDPGDPLRELRGAPESSAGPDDGGAHAATTSRK